MLLLVVATALEITPWLAAQGLPVPPGEKGLAGTLLETPRCDVLITGVGQMQCAAHLGRVLAGGRYSRVVNAGIAGSFSPQFAKGSVVLVAEEALADLGAESPAGLLDAFDMGLVATDAPPFDQGWLRALPAWFPSDLALPCVRSVTVNRVLSDAASIAWVRERYAPDIVNMEGAAVFYTCLAQGIPCLELRAISDFVGPRDKASWDLPGALRALQDALVRVIATLGNDT